MMQLLQDANYEVHYYMDEVACYMSLESEFQYLIHQRSYYTSYGMYDNDNKETLSSRIEWLREEMQELKEKFKKRSKAEYNKKFSLYGQVLNLKCFNPTAKNVDEGYYYYPYALIREPNGYVKYTYLILYSYGTNNIQDWAYEQVARNYIRLCPFNFSQSTVFIVTGEALEYTA